MWLMRADARAPAKEPACSVGFSTILGLQYIIPSSIEQTPPESNRPIRRAIGKPVEVELLDICTYVHMYMCIYVYMYICIYVLLCAQNCFRTPSEMLSQDSTVADTAARMMEHGPTLLGSQALWPQNGSRHSETWAVI